MIVTEITLLRERFVLSNESNPKKRTDAASNRIQIVVTRQNRPVTYVIRSKTMHSCIRLAARLLASFGHDENNNLIQKHQDWDAAWDYIHNKYEREFNPENWCALYVEGEVLYHAGKRPPLLDIIENFNVRHTGSYEESIAAAQAAFQKEENNISITYLSNIAWNVALKEGKARFHGQIRGPDGTKTFGFSIAENTLDNRKFTTLNLIQCMYASAAFLEGFQLAYLIKRLDAKVSDSKDEAVPPASAEDIEHNKMYKRKALERLGTLNREIRKLEQNYIINYRPERPNLFELIDTE